MIAVKLALAAGLLWGVQPSPLLSPDAGTFTRAMAERFRQAAPQVTFRITADLQLGAKAPGQEEEAEINLNRVYDFCRRNPADECLVLGEDFVTALVPTLSPIPPLAREQLRLMVRHSGYCEELGSRERERGDVPDGIVMRPVGPSLCAVLVADSPRTMASVQVSTLTPLNLSVDQAWQLAERQTLTNLPEIDTIEALATEMIVVADMDYVPSLVLAREAWRRAAARHGELLMAVPADGIMVVTRRSLVNDVAALRATVREQFDTASRGISPHIYRWSSEGWTILN